MRTWLTISCALLAFSCSVLARGAGRAFPMVAENFVIDNFQDVNPDIEWDPTNYLVDKSGQFANCDTIRRSYEDLTDRTPEGQSIAVVYDYIEGPRVDAEGVNLYIKDIVARWMRMGTYRDTIREADRFGCSVRPGCRDRRPGGLGSMVVTVACLFSPGSYQGEGPVPLPEPRGLAFTPQQYKVAERITGNNWDASHFLENLAGIEASCAMIEDPDWSFKEAQDIADEYEIEVFGLKGQAPNLGSTQQAMEEILKDFKRIRSSSKVGCSVIPDCMGRGDIGGGIMWVVVACIYQEPPYSFF